MAFTRSKIFEPTTINRESSPMTFQHRLAQESDIPQIQKLMALAIRRNMVAFLSPAEIEAAQETMGVDRTLIEDQCYFLIENTLTEGDPLVACGGWGRRHTLYGGDHTVGRDDSFSDPANDAARIRAMYTHPDYLRQGLGSLLLELSEGAARAAGYHRIELGSTLPGEPFYRARGYEELSRQRFLAANGAENTIIKMSKNL